MNCCGSLGFRKAFPVAFVANLALSRQAGRALLPLRGDGKLHFFFRSTHDPNVLTVQLEDAALLLRPLTVKLHGRDEPVEVPQVLLGRQVFDLNACNGLLNLTTQEFTLNLQLTLTRDCIPQLALAGIGAPISIHIVEKGHLNLSEGKINTHATSFDVSGGLMSALVVHPGAKDERTALDFKNSVFTCDAEMKAQGTIGVTAANLCAERGAHELWTCPKKDVTLCWVSKGVNQQYSTNPGMSTGLGVSGSFIVNPTADTTYTFQVEGNKKDKDGNFCRSTDDVTVHIVSPGQKISLQANLDSTEVTWSVIVSPYAFDPDIIITSIYTVACPLTGAEYPTWSCRKTDVDGTPHIVAVGVNPSPAGFSIVGTYLFTPDILGPFRGQGTACFEVTVKCV